MGKVSFGWAIPTFSGINDTHIDAPCYERFEYITTEKTAILCEKLGYNNLWIADHLILANRGEIVESWTLLSALAAITKKIRLGPLVFCDGLRKPALVAKMVATLDNISGGRVDYGVGAGWHKFEQESYGLPWLEKPGERIKRMEEGIEIVKRMWTEEKPSFEGRYYKIKEAICNPKPIQKPHPPIWIAGQGRRMLKSVAKYADGWNWFSTSPREHKMLIETIKKHCKEIGRNFNNITISWDGHILIAKNKYNLKRKIDQIKQLSPLYPLSLEKIVMEMPLYPFAHRAEVGANPETIDFRAHNFVGTPEEIVERMQQYIDVGVKHFMLWFLDYPSIEGIELFAEKVIPELT